MLFLISHCRAPVRCAEPKVDKPLSDHYSVSTSSWSPRAACCCWSTTMCVRGSGACSGWMT